jgi:hypothetical protein
MRQRDETFEGQLRIWCGSSGDDSSQHFMVLRLYLEEHSGYSLVDFVQGGTIYRAFSLHGMLQLSEPVT